MFYQFQSKLHILYLIKKIIFDLSFPVIRQSPGYHRRATAATAGRHLLLLPSPFLLLYLPSLSSFFFVGILEKNHLSLFFIIIMICFFFFSSILTLTILNYIFKIILLNKVYKRKRSFLIYLFRWVDRGIKLRYIIFSCRQQIRRQRLLGA